MDQTTKILIAAGLIGGGIYLYTRQAQAAQFAAVQPTPTATPSWLELVASFGKGIGESLTSQMNSVEAKVKAMGVEYYGAWKLALKNKKKYFEVPTIAGTVCMETATGNKVATAQCTAQNVLEGY